METVIVTVSGYNSVTREKLVKLIVHAGASNTGSLSNCNTHVVCWKFKGPKFELAKKLNKKIISHRWFEDCVKAGVLLPEDQYINKSGEEEAPLSWDDSMVQTRIGRASQIAESNIKLSETTSQLETSSCRSTVASARDDGLSAHHLRSSHHRETGWSPIFLSSSSVFADSDVSPRNSSAGREQAGFSGVTNLDEEQECDVNVIAAVGTTKDGDQPDFLLNQAPVNFMTERVASVSESVCCSSMDQSNGMRHQEREAYNSRCYPDEVGHQATHSCLPITSESGPRRYKDFKADYTQIRLEKRKEVEAPSGGLSEKYRRLMNEAPSGGLNEKYERLRNASPPIASGKLTCGDERAGSTSRTCSCCLRGPSSQCSTRRIHSALIGNSYRVGRYACAKTECADKLDQEASISASPSDDIACVICHSETKPTTEGLLECGHRFCYPCIKKWADEATSKQSTCPLCKASFEFITIRELERSANEEICTQVLEERVVLVGKQIRQGQKNALPCPRPEGMCITCESKDSPELLISCNRCGQRSCHTFCLDPPQSPGSSWFCSRCLPMRSRYVSRESVMTRFLS
ncbi:hypothetical protein Mp_8g05690 [Marchantia polymorpha subsp. ruderalis]|nr:hypothetical protein MARPO_0081s0071 [Marchantia polymorpha]BBN18810.1 hypothetical protein Mp_8g05690 [Marchantia polymorpha subsp. ruderalis]|eukprot:PTQ34350.1 hypothetical protein MARPO_0081s0071 [Marchantia polymorpha]